MRASRWGRCDACWCCRRSAVAWVRLLYRVSPGCFRVFNDCDGFAVGCLVLRLPLVLSGQSSGSVVWVAFRVGWRDLVSSLCVGLGLAVGLSCSLPVPSQVAAMGEAKLAHAAYFSFLFLLLSSCSFLLLLLFSSSPFSSSALRWGPSRSPLPRKNLCPIPFLLLSFLFLAMCGSTGHRYRIS